MNKYIIIRHDRKTGYQSPSEIKTFEEHVEDFSYSLEVGAAYQHERGNKKINQNPKTPKSLINNLNNAKSNAAKDGYSRFWYEICKYVG